VSPTAPVRPRRSVLYLPAANARALEKVAKVPCDGVILDLEDAVAPEAKALARDQAVKALQSKAYGSRELIIRLNGKNTPWHAQDVAAVAQARPDAVLIPKVEAAADIAAVRAALGEHGPPLWAMVETPKAVLALAEVANAPGLTCLVMGTSDLVTDLRAQHMPGRENLLAALSLTVLAARAHGLAVLDGVHLALDDAQGLAAACAQGRALGFDGKTLIHPCQVEAANAAFGPTAAEVAHAQAVLAAYEAALADGKGVAVLNGKLVENLHAAEARRTLALAAAIGAMAPTPGPV
jgi:citrate lyase subunit beta / citryl-CoA lyase